MSLKLYTRIFKKKMSLSDATFVITAREYYWTGNITHSFLEKIEKKCDWNLFDEKSCIGKIMSSLLKSSEIKNNSNMNIGLDNFSKPGKIWLFGDDMKSEYLDDNIICICFDLQTGDYQLYYKLDKYGNNCKIFNNPADIYLLEKIFNKNDIMQKEDYHLMYVPLKESVDIGHIKKNIDLDEKCNIHCNSEKYYHLIHIPVEESGDIVNDICHIDCIKNIDLDEKCSVQCDSKKYSLENSIHKKLHDYHLFPKNINICIRKRKNDTSFQNAIRVEESSVSCLLFEKNMTFLDE